MLGISNDEELTPELLRKRFKLMALRYHPDKNPGNKAAAELFVEVNAANEFLMQELQEVTQARERARQRASHFDTAEELRRAADSLRQRRQASARRAGARGGAGARGEGSEDWKEELRRAAEELRQKKRQRAYSAQQQRRGGSPPPRKREENKSSGTWWREVADWVEYGLNDFGDSEQFFVVLTAAAALCFTFVVMLFLMALVKLNPTDVIKHFTQTGTRLFYGFDSRDPSYSFDDFGENARRVREMWDDHGDRWFGAIVEGFSRVPQVAGGLAVGALRKVYRSSFGWVITAVVTRGRPVARSRLNLCMVKDRWITRRTHAAQGLPTKLVPPGGDSMLMQQRLV